VLEQVHSVAVLEHDDGVGNPEDAFRRATFNWALSTKKMVELSNALGKNPRVARAALADIEYAREMLDKLYVPVTTKTPAAFADGRSLITAPEVQESVSGLAARIIALPLSRAGDSECVRLCDHEVSGRHSARCQAGETFASKPAQSRRAADLSASVHPKNGKMLWAGIDCPVCPSVATQRCRKDDGVFIEKPHAPRKELADVQAEHPAVLGNEPEEASEGQVPQV